MKLKPSEGQPGITLLKDISLYYGKLIPFLEACLKPSGQISFEGDPSTEQILLIWSISEFPWNKGLMRYISATKQPKAKISTGVEYVENLNKS